MEHFFHRIPVDTYAHMHTRVKLLGGDADVDHTQTIGGIQSKLLGRYIPLGFGTPGQIDKILSYTLLLNLRTDPWSSG